MIMTAGDQPGSGGKVCPNCGAVITGKFCSACGTEEIPPRLTFKSLILVTLDHFLSLDVPWFRTVIDLLRFPGRVAAAYVAGRRRHYMGPLRFNLINAALLMALIHFIGGENPEVPKNFKKFGESASDAFALFLHWNNTYLQVIYVLSLPLLALAMRVVFWRSNRNVMEHYILGLYTFAEIYLIQGACILLATYVKWRWVDRGCEFVSGSAPFLYFSWGAVGFMRTSAPRSTWMSIVDTISVLVRAMLASFVFSVVISGIMFAVAMIVVLKHQQAGA